MIKNTYSARFTAEGFDYTASRTSHHEYKTAALAVKDGVNYANPVFSAGVARPIMPGDALRRMARAACYSSNERAKFRKQGEEADKGWVALVVPVEAVK